MRLSICLVAVVMIHSLAGCFAQSTSAGAARVQVELPVGWESKTPSKPAVQFAEYPDLVAYFQLLVELKSDFADNVDLNAWAKLVKENSAKKSTLAKRKDTEIQERRIGGRATLEYEVTGELKGWKLPYRNIMLQSGDDYCKLTCWTTPSHWKDAQAKFDELVSRLR